jgi:hypothetical protein
MNACSDFALCTRRAESCSLHGLCARAQMGSRNPLRQSFVAPQKTGDACILYFSFSPFLQLAANGGGIADTLAESENLGRSAHSQAGAASSDAAGESGSANTLTPAGSDAANTEPRTNAEAGGVSIPERGARAIGVAVGDVVHEPAGVPSASAGLGTEIAQQLNALRIFFGRS